MAKKKSKKSSESFKCACGGKHSYVQNTIGKDDAVKRYRICYICGATIPTEERKASEMPEKTEEKNTE